MAPNYPFFDQKWDGKQDTGTNMYAPLQICKEAGFERDVHIHSSVAAYYVKSIWVLYNYNLQR